MTGNARNTARLTITVKPHSSRNALEVAGGSLIVRVTAPPVEGKANEMCLSLIADWLGVPKSRLTIISGARQRQKIVGVAGLSQAEINRKLGPGSPPAAPGESKAP